MLKYLEMTGKTEEEAVEKALAQLGLDRDDVSVELLERAKSGFLGLGSSPARIRVQYEAPDETPAAAPEEAAADPARGSRDPGDPVYARYARLVRSAELARRGEMPFPPREGLRNPRGHSIIWIRILPFLHPAPFGKDSWKNFF